MKASWVFLLKKQQELEIPVKPTIEKLKKNGNCTQFLGLNSVTRNLGAQIARYICNINFQNSLTFKVMR